MKIINGEPVHFDPGVVMGPEFLEHGPTEYERFLHNKAQGGTNAGFAPFFLPDFLYYFQSDLVDWSVRKGRAAIFADCGLGKTPIQLVWAQNVVEKTNKPVLILTPLAVGAQTVREGEKFHIQARRTYTGEVHPGINIAEVSKNGWNEATNQEEMFAEIDEMEDVTT